jgi:hypothetical protein
MEAPQHVIHAASMPEWSRCGKPSPRRRNRATRAHTSDGADGATERTSPSLRMSQLTVPHQAYSQQAEDTPD